MPIGITYNAGDLILQSVSSSGNTFQENKIAAATSSIILFNVSGNLTSQSLNDTTVGTSSYLSGSNIIVSSITASNISASGNISASTFVGSLTGSLFGTSSWSTNSLTASSLVAANSYTITNLTSSNISASATGSFGIVGIGTASPTARLHVNSNSANGQIKENIVVDGQTQSTTTSGSGQVIAFKGSGAAYFGGVGGFGNGTLAGVGLWGGTVSITGSNPQLFVASSGNVGIGTTSPGEKLNISGGSIRFDGTNNYVYLQNGNSDSSPFLASVANVLTTANYGWGFFDRGTEGNFQLQYRAGSTSWNPAITVLRTTGNVGIGTTNPAYLLDVSGSSRHGYRSADTHQFTGSVSISGSLNATSSWSTNSLTASYVTSSNVVGTVTSASYALSASFAPSTITASWSTNALTASSLVSENSYTITNLTASNISTSATGSFGMVGIGTTRPVALLSVVPSGSAFDNTNAMVAYFGKNTTSSYGSTFIRVAISHNTITTGSANAATDIEQNSGGSGPFRYGTYVDTNIINSQTATNGVYGSINFVTSGSARMTIAGGTSAGNVGIGTVSPDASLYVKRNSSGHVFRAASNLPTAALMGSFERQNGSGIVTGATRFGFTSNISEIQSLLGFAFFINGTSDLNSNANGTQSLTILSTSGNVGIGTTSPAYLLDVSGSSRFGYRSADTHQFTGSVSISGSLNATSSWSTNSLTASYVTSSNVVGTVTSASYALSSSFSPTTITASWATNALTASSLVSANSYTITNLTASNIRSNGTLHVNLGTIDCALTGATLFSGANAITIGGGSVTTTFPGVLSVTGASSLNSTLTVLGATVLNNTLSASGVVTASNIYGAGTLNVVGVSTLGTVSASIFVGAHTGSLFGTSSWATNALTASSLVVGNSYNIANLTASDISASGTGSFGMVGIGTSSPGAILEVSSSTALTVFNVKGAGGANLFTVSGSGNIGVGTTPSTSYKMQINGSFSATTKSFDIDHPVKSGKRLVYGSLESPYHGVRLTGKGKLVKGKGVIQLPDYMNALVDYDNPNVQITNIKHNKVIYVDGIDEKNNIINIATKIPKTQLNKELEFYWTFTAVRKDVPPLQVEL